MPERFPTIAEAALQPGSDQKRIHDTIVDEMSKYFTPGTFTLQDTKTKAVLGPFTQFLYLPQPVYDGWSQNIMSLAAIPSFPIKCREIVILTIGEHYGAPFELYGHVRIAKRVGLSDRQIQDVIEGRQPSEGTEQEIFSWELARALINMGGPGRKGPLSNELWAKAEKMFGKEGAGALIHYVGVYSYTSIILNAAAVPVPPGEKVWPIPQPPSLDSDSGQV